MPQNVPKKVNNLHKVTSLYARSQNLNHDGTKQGLSIQQSHPSLTVTCCMTVDKFPILETQFPSLQHGVRCSHQKHTTTSM